MHEDEERALRDTGHLFEDWLAYMDTQRKREKEDSIMYSADEDPNWGDAA